MAEQLYSWTLLCAEDEVGPQFTRSTTVRVVEADLPAAIAHAKRVLGDEAAKKRIFFPAEIVEIRDSA